MMVENKVKGKRVYICGPMSGIELNNVAEFCRMEAMLKVLGASHICNPAKRWLDSKRESSYEESMRWCIGELVSDKFLSVDRNTDFLVRLSGWNHSDGATLESKVARMCGIPILEQKDVEAMYRG